AVGLVVSQRRRDVQRTLLLGGEEMTSEAIGATVSELGDRARDAVGEEQAELQATYEMRYRGQSFELAIPGSLGPDPEELREAFEVEHETRYGYRDAEQSVELVTIRITATTAGAEVPLARPGQRDEPGRSRRP